MTCTHCIKAKSELFYGIYDISCLRCCARLVVSARGVGKAQQEKMLEHIARAKNSHKRAEILDYIKTSM